MRDPLNFFEPYESLPPTHENQLTRAFLIVLRLVPIARAAAPLRRTRHGVPMSQPAFHLAVAPRLAGPIPPGRRSSHPVAALKVLHEVVGLEPLTSDEVD
jgi:hypothetical protein